MSDALASNSDLRHLHLGFEGARVSASDEWCEPLFRTLRCCRRLDTVQLEHGDDADDGYFTRLNLGKEFRGWLGTSTTLKSLTMNRFSFNRCFLSNAAIGLLRSTSLVSLDFQNTKFEDLSVLGSALVDGATLQEFRIDTEAISNEFLLQLANATHLETLIVDGKFDDHLVLLADALRHNMTLQRINTSTEIDNSDDTEEIEEARAKLDHYLTGTVGASSTPACCRQACGRSSWPRRPPILSTRSSLSLVRSRRGVTRSRRQSSSKYSRV